MLEDDPEGQKGTPYEQVRAEQDSQQPRDAFEINDQRFPHPASRAAEGLLLLRRNLPDCAQPVDA